jgi:hypothetical protein
MMVNIETTNTVARKTFQDMVLSWINVVLAGSSNQIGPPHVT